MAFSDELRKAVEWALQQTFDDGTGDIIPITKDTPHALVEKVRQYFNDNGVSYETFAFDDLKPYL